VITEGRSSTTGILIRKCTHPRAYDCLALGGAFVVIENLIDDADARKRYLGGLMMSLNMLMVR